MAIHPSAVIDSSAQVHDSVEIGPHVVIGEDVIIGEGCQIMQGASIQPRVRMGKNNRVHPHAIIGCDPQYVGFDPSTKSGVVIGDNNELRESVTIHRGLKDGADTVIGNNCMMMVGSHAGHDCVIGDHVIMANGALLSGHVIVEDRVFISGNCGVHQFCRIGKLTMIGGLTGVSKDVPPFAMLRGDVAYIVGVNTIGLRRAGVNTESRMAIKRAFRELFQSGRALSGALKDLRAYWNEKGNIPEEVEYLLTYCETRTKRGLTSGRSIEHPRPVDSGDSE